MGSGSRKLAQFALEQRKRINGTTGTPDYKDKISDRIESSSAPTKNLFFETVTKSSPKRRGHVNPGAVRRNMNVQTSTPKPTPTAAPVKRQSAAPKRKSAAPWEASSGQSSKAPWDATGGQSLRRGTKSSSAIPSSKSSVELKGWRNRSKNK